MRINFFLAFVFLFTGTCFGQVGEYLGDEKAFFAATKQVNQFLRRFNGEENLQGKRYFPQDSSYRNPALRSKYIKILFDNKQENISIDSKKAFLRGLPAGIRDQFRQYRGRCSWCCY